MRTTFHFAFVVAVALFPKIASADEAVPAEQPTVTQQPEVRPGRGVGFGMDNGLFGRAYEQGVRIRIPLAEHFAINLRGISTFASASADETRWELGGRAELIGFTPVYLSLVRLYGGGGPEVATWVSGPGAKETRIGGGGHFGFEFFVNPRMSFFAEIGGHAGDELTGGGTALAGMTFYPFTGP